MAHRQRLINFTVRNREFLTWIYLGLVILAVVRLWTWARLTPCAQPAVCVRRGGGACLPGACDLARAHRQVVFWWVTALVIAPLMVRIVVQLIHKLRSER
jgi:hypothetical protein